MNSILTTLQRLPAEELSKSKWIKIASKIPNTLLKEMLVRYDAWSDGGGARTSLADPLGWEDEESQYVPGVHSHQGSNVDSPTGLTTGHHHYRMGGSSIPSGACQD